MTCADCKHWVRRDLQGDGECRANPPQAIVSRVDNALLGRKELQVQSIHPPTASTHWCGQYAAKANAIGHAG